MAFGDLKRHLLKCVGCRLVLKAQMQGKMCEEGIALTHKCAVASTRLVTLHRKAYNDPMGFIYACPDRTKHGNDYAVTAQPHLNVAIQDELF